MGAVYYGVHPRLMVEVAVKVLPFHLADSAPEMIQRTFSEAQTAARVKSPHLVGVHDVNQESGIYYLVMEFVRGKTAGGRLKALKATGAVGLPEAEALDICIAATTGLAAAHKANIIHRDIKPDNILIPFAAGAPAGTHGPLDFSVAKLSDLGLARREGSDKSLTGTQACMGTPGYMSFEQAQDAEKAGKPADVFSMAATLYALLSGHAPFKGSSATEIILETAQDRRQPIGEVRPDVSPATGELLNRCLAKDPTARCVDGAALLQELKACRAALDAGKRTQTVSSGHYGKVALEQQVAEFQKLSLLDTLTEVGNRRFGESQLLARLNEFQRTTVQFGVLFLDLDNFKAVNDTYGHEVGDRVLKMVARILAANVRSFDQVSRWGGEEFLVIVTNVDLPRLCAIAEKLRLLVMSSQLTDFHPAVRTTLSIGAAIVARDDTVESIMARADKLLYQSKGKGRNCVTSVLPA